MPKRTIQLLEDLRAAGLTDDEFRIIHHRDANTITAHLKYCATIDQFQGDDSTNARVRDRLELMARAYSTAKFSDPARPGVLRALADAAAAEIPKD